MGLTKRIRLISNAMLYSCVKMVFNVRGIVKGKSLDISRNHKSCKNNDKALDDLDTGRRYSD